MLILIEMHILVCKAASRSVLDIWTDDLLGNKKKSEQIETKEKQDKMNKVMKNKDRTAIACTVSE